MFLLFLVFRINLTCSKVNVRLLWLDTDLTFWSISCCVCFQFLMAYIDGNTRWLPQTEQCAGFDLNSDFFEVPIFGGKWVFVCAVEHEMVNVFSTLCILSITHQIKGYRFSLDRVSQQKRICIVLKCNRITFCFHYFTVFYFKF